MPFKPCTEQFDSLATRPLQNSMVGDLAALHEPGINLVLGTRTFSADALEALRQVNAQELTLQHGASHGGAKYGLFNANNIAPQDLPKTLRAGLFGILPHHHGNLAVAHDLGLMLQDVAGVYNNAPLTISAIANVPGAQGVFHHDNFTEHRWLITLPTGSAPGTWVLDDFARDHGIMLDQAMNGAGSSKGWQHNNYGRPTALWNHLIREAPVGRVLGWHGEETGTPRLHSEPDVLTPEQTRITLIATPTAMLERQSQRARAYKPGNT